MFKRRNLLDQEERLVNRSIDAKVVRNYRAFRGLAMVFKVAFLAAILSVVAQHHVAFLFGSASITVTMATVLWFRGGQELKARVFAIASGGIAIAAMCEIYAKQFPLFSGAFIIAFIFLVLSAWKLGSVSREQRDIFVTWLSLNQPLRRFPTDPIARAKLIMWADKLLRPLATGVTKAFKARDDLQTLVTNAYNALRRVEEDTSPCEPRDLPSWRREIGRAKRSAKLFGRDRDRAARCAEKAQKRYLVVWDFLTKPEPEGIGILTGTNYRNPDSFRHRVSEEKAGVSPSAA